MQIVRSPGTGFTLVELLVVVAIVGLLGALAVPVVGQSLSAAKRAGCASNMRQIGIAMHLYAQDHDGWLPESSHVSTSRSWIYTLEPYLGEQFEEVRICPADPRADQRRQAGGSSYVLNEFTSLDVTDPFGNLLEASHRHLRRMVQPSRTLILFTVSDRVGVSAANDHTHSRNWGKGWQSIVADIQPDRHRSGAASPDSTKGSANYLYADGHVENIPARSLKQLVDQGINPARPPS